MKNTLKNRDTFGIWLYPIEDVNEVSALRADVFHVREFVYKAWHI